MALNRSGSDEQFENRSLRFKNSLAYRDDNDFTVVSVRMGKMRKDALQEHLKITTGEDLSTFIRKLVYEYMDLNEIKPLQ